MRWDTVLRMLGLDASKSTIQRILRRHNITKWRAKGRPKLTAAAAEARLQFAIEHANWGEEEWARIVWSDECSVEKGSGQNTKWVFRTPSQKWEKEMIAPFLKGKQASVMIWGAFSGIAGVSELVIMTRDSESKRGGYSARSYINTLQQGLIPYIDDGMLFMHNNAPIHTAQLTREWLELQHVEAINWPPYSPDLNPIEHIWPHLKTQINLDHPELINEHGSHDRLRQLMGPYLIEAWGQIRESIFESCWKSMRRRCGAVIEAEGWYTRY
jgi:hypothetical protein